MVAFSSLLIILLQNNNYTPISIAGGKMALGGKFTDGESSWWQGDCITRPSHLRKKPQCHCQGLYRYTFFRLKIQGLFKEFQGPNFEISRTSLSFTSKNLPMEIV